MKTDVNLVNLYEPVMKIDESNHLQLVELLMECTAIQVLVNMLISNTLLYSLFFIEYAIGLAYTQKIKLVPNQFVTSVDESFFLLLHSFQSRVGKCP